jgi:hypothetical protein
VQATFGSSLDQQVEPPFYFIRELSSSQTPWLRDPQSRPSNNEIDLTRGWVMLRPAKDSRIPAELAEEFQTYLRSAFGCEIKLGDGSVTESNVLEVSINPAISKTTGSYEANFLPQAIRIVGQDLIGPRQAFYDLQDRLEERNGPFIPYGMIQRVGVLSLRYLYPYFGLYGDPLMQMEKGVDSTEGYLQS